MLHAPIVHAHPEPESFCAAQTREAVPALKEQGNTVEISNLYQMNWSPAPGRNDFEHELAGHFKPKGEQIKAVHDGTFAPDIAAEIEKVQRAELLVFSFPRWGFSLPSVLEGWVDRVFAMAAVYGGTVGRFETGGFQGRRATLLFATGSTEDMVGPGARDGGLDAILFHLQHAMFYFVGYNILAPITSFGRVRKTLEEREQPVAVRAAFSNVEARTVLSWNTGQAAPSR